MWIPIELIEDKKLDWHNKVLLSEIYSLVKLEDGCFASNEHFAELLGVEKSAASKRISKLKEWGYINCKNQYKNKQCIGRIITRSSSPKNHTVVPPEQEGSSHKTVKVVPSEPLGISQGKPINTVTNSILKEQLPVHTGAETPVDKNSNTEPATFAQVFKEQYQDAAAFLYDATILGADIFSFIDSNYLDQLKSRIGIPEYRRIEQKINNYIHSARQLGYI